MKKGVVVLLIIMAGILPASAIFTPTIPTDCSNQQISGVWDSIFKESSSGIIIASNTAVSGKCEGYMAIKNYSTMVYFLAGQDKSVKEISAFKGNLSQEDSEFLKSLGMN